MDDAMIISCGHSVGNAGRRRVMETVRDPSKPCLVVFYHTAMNVQRRALALLYNGVPSFKRFFFNLATVGTGDLL